MKLTKGEHSLIKLVHISDTHGKHNELTEKIPSDTDILVHSGDWSHYEIPEETEAFLQWFRKMPGKHKILVAGNHDSTFSQSKDVHQEFDLSGIHYLFNESVEIEGLKFYGSPSVPLEVDMAFTFFGHDEAFKIWQKIPDDTEVLITHGPASGIFDRVRRGYETLHLGCQMLAKRISELEKLRYHFFGHVHQTNGVLQKGNVTYSNAATTIHVHEIPIVETEVNDS